MKTLTCGVVIVIAHLLAADLRAQQPVPYKWQSVVIKANGFIDGLVFNSAEKGLFYIHTDMGGAYRHDSAKGEWVCLTDWIQHDDWSLSQMGVETMAVDPTDAGRVYAAIGTYMGPSAIVRSTDRGQTWQRTNVGFTMNGNGSARNAGERMNVDPNLTSRLIYGTRNKGIWKSDDSAATWKRIESFAPIGDTTEPAKDTGVVWTLFDQSSGKPGTATPVVYAGVCTEQPDKVFRSLDGGATWSPIPDQPGGKLLPTRAAISPDGGRMYLTYVVGDRYLGPWGVVGGDVYRIDQPASSSPKWTTVSPVEGKFGFSGISIDPTSIDTLYVSTLDRYDGPKDDIYRSTDGGRTWTALNINTSRDDSSAQYVKDFGMHWVGDVQVDPHYPDHAFFTTGYGMYRTTNLRAEKPTWAFYNEGFEQSAVLELVSPPTGSANLISAIGDRDGYRHENLAESPKLGRLGQENDRGQKTSRAMGTCDDIDFAWQKPLIMARVGSSAQYSNDGGVTWEWFTPQPRDGEQSESRSRPHGGSIALSADGSTAVWAPDRGDLLYAQRKGDGWSEWLKAVGAPRGHSMVVADYVNPKTLYLRGSDALYISTDGGETWSKQPGDLPSDPRWLRAIPEHEGHLWLTAGEEGKGGLHRSIDGGKSWTRVRPELIVAAKQVGFGAGAPGADYPSIFIGGTVGDVRGFFRSDDQGATWLRVNDDAHQYGNVTVINGDTRVHGRLYVGTNGRGILYGDPAESAGEKK
ncbi:hypothetical protein BH09PLA1_BH09PLA1_28320 [soil metagenome]